MIQSWVSEGTKPVKSFISVVGKPNTLNVFVSLDGLPVVRKVQLLDRVTLDIVQTGFSEADGNCFFSSVPLHTNGLFMVVLDEEDTGSAMFSLDFLDQELRFKGETSTITVKFSTEPSLPGSYLTVKYNGKWRVPEKVLVRQSGGWVQVADKVSYNQLVAQKSAEKTKAVAEKEAELNALFQPQLQAQYDSGYSDGLAAGTGVLVGDLEDARQVGYQEGYTKGLADGYIAGVSAVITDSNYVPPGNSDLSNADDELFESALRWLPRSTALGMELVDGGESPPKMISAHGVEDWISKITLYPQYDKPDYYNHPYFFNESRVYLDWENISFSKVFSSRSDERGYEITIPSALRTYSDNKADEFNISRYYAPTAFYIPFNLRLLNRPLVFEFTIRRKTAVGNPVVRMGSNYEMRNERCLYLSARSSQGHSDSTRYSYYQSRYTHYSDPVELLPVERIYKNIWSNSGFHKEALKVDSGLGFENADPASNWGDEEVVCTAFIEPSKHTLSVCMHSENLAFTRVASDPFPMISIEAEKWALWMDFEEAIGENGENSVYINPGHKPFKSKISDLANYINMDDGYFTLAGLLGMTDVGFSDES